MARVPFFTIGLPQFPVTTNKDVEPDLRDVYNSIRNLAYQIGQYGGFEAADQGSNVTNNATVTLGAYKRRLYCQALEAMPYGAAVNLTLSGGTAKARFANATNNTRPCLGLNNTLGTCAIGDTIEVALPGCYVTSITGLVEGIRYFLSTVNGVISNAAPAAAGNVREALGFAVAPNIFYFFPDMGWTVI